MSKNKVVEVKKAEPPPPPPPMNKLEKLQHIYETMIEDEKLREVVTQQIDLRSAKLVDKIKVDDNAFPNEMEEVDVKPLIRQWRGTFMKDEIKNFARNHLYVTDTKMGKKDLERNLKILDNNIDAMGTTNGFQQIEKQLGLNDKILQKNSKISALKPMKDMEYFTNKQKTYDEKKKENDEEWQKHLDEAQKLMDALNEEKKLRKEKIKEIKQKRKQNREKKEAERLKALEEEEIKKKKENEVKLKEHAQKLQKIKENRDKQIAIMNENTKKIERPRYTTIQKEYKQKVLMPALDKKKEMLKSIRDLHKPIRLDEINEYKRKIDEIVEKKKQQRYLERTEFYENHKNNYRYKDMETNFIQAVKEQDIQAKEDAEKKEAEKRELTEKMKSYGEMIKEMHWPTVSKKKQLEMQLLKESMKHPVRKRLNGSTLSSKNLHSRRSAESLLGVAKPGMHSDMDDDQSQTIKRRKLIWKENPMVPKPKPKKEPIIIDWLQDRRNKRAEDKQDGAIRSSPIAQNWKKEIENGNYTQQEKYDLIKEKTKQLETDAKRKEEMITLAKAGTIEDRDKINDMIFESIKAKLSILEDFNS